MTKLEAIAGTGTGNADRVTLGYVRGKPCKIIIVKVSGVWCESRTALAFGEMQAAAKADGIDLIALEGWRAMEMQIRLWQERQCSCVPKLRAPPADHEEKCPIRVLGPAARPGWSNHQSGHAIDIKTGMTIMMLSNGKTTPVYRWLVKNAARFGFRRTVKSEPWHWEFIGAPEQRPEEVA